MRYNTILEIEKYARLSWCIVTHSAVLHYKYHLRKSYFSCPLLLKKFIQHITAHKILQYSSVTKFQQKRKFILCMIQDFASSSAPHSHQYARYAIQRNVVSTEKVASSEKDQNKLGLKTYKVFKTSKEGVAKNNSMRRRSSRLKISPGSSGMHWIPNLAKCSSTPLVL